MSCGLLLLIAAVLKCFALAKGSAALFLPNAVFPVLTERTASLLGVQLDISTVVLLLLFKRRSHLCFCTIGTLGCLYVWYHLFVHYLGAKDVGALAEAIPRAKS